MESLQRANGCYGKGRLQETRVTTHFGALSMLFHARLSQFIHNKSLNTSIFKSDFYSTPPLVWRCRYLCGRTNVRVFRSLVLPVLLYGCETWTLTKDLRWRFNSFGTRSLRRILGYRWSDFVSNEWLLRETQMRFVTCLVHERQLRLYGHVARFPDADPPHQILSVREPLEWKRLMG